MWFSDKKVPVIMIVLQIHIKLASIKLCIQSSNAEKLTVLRCYYHNLNTDRKRRLGIWSGLFSVAFYENADLHIWYTSALLYRTLTVFYVANCFVKQQHPYFNRSKKLVINTTRADIGSKRHFKHLYISYPILLWAFREQPLRGPGPHVTSATNNPDYIFLWHSKPAPDDRWASSNVLQLARVHCNCLPQHHAQFWRLLFSFTKADEPMFCPKSYLSLTHRR